MKMNQRFRISLIEEWTEFFHIRGFNWVTMHPLMVEFEIERAMGTFYFTFIFMGVGFQLLFVYNSEAEVRQKIAESMKDIETFLGDRDV